MANSDYSQEHFKAGGSDQQALGTSEVRRLDLQGSVIG